MIMSFLDFPVEILTRILLLLGVRDIVRCRQLARQFQSIVDDTVEIQYHLEFLISDMESSQTSDLPRSERLGALKAYNNAWRTLQWSSDIEFTSTQSHCREWQGIWVTLQNSEQWSFHQLPSPLRGIPEKKWSFLCKPHPEDDDEYVWEFTLDVSNDLFVLVHWGYESMDRDIVICLFSLTDGTEYSGASDPVIISQRTQKEDDEGSVDGFALQLRANHLCISTTGYLRIVDWTTGVTQKCIATSNLGAFLTDQYYITMQHKYKKSMDESLLRVWNLESPTAERVCSLRLPQMRRGFEILGAPVSCGPHAPPLHAPPFHGRDSDRIFVLSFDVVERKSGWDAPRNGFGLCVPVSSILEHVRLSPNKDHVWRWDEWGSQHGRMLLGPFHMDAAGMRAIINYPDPDLEGEGEKDLAGEGEITFSLLDFNQYQPPVGTDHLSSQIVKEEVVLTPTELPSKFFDVAAPHNATRLPYRILHVRLHDKPTQRFWRFYGDGLYNESSEPTSVEEDGNATFRSLRF